ncbi:dynein axonemal heavy chain 10-like [Conger conger]|uniref:dynein axonemal heavy chain 10-like n=1 Tax=Conger conger TaxID=82655 RepID=UPI002A59AE56|nr:dynein axonemal heavy chain 10-like [Conger conger]
MVFMDPKNLRNAPYWQKWVKTRGSKEQPELDRLFEKYVPMCIDTIVDGVMDGKQEEKLKTIVPQTDLNMELLENNRPGHNAHGGKDSL